MRNFKLKSLTAIAAITLAASTGTAQAALHAREGGMVYDDVLNLTWLADMSYAQTSGYSSDGKMGWATAKSWAESLNYGGFNDWRLPTLNAGDTSCSNSFDAGGSIGLQYGGFNCTGSELSHLFAVDLGDKAGESVLNQTGDTAEQRANLALFSNMKSDRYWSGSAYAPLAGAAWTYHTDVGAQGYAAGDLGMYSVAVRSGDVAAVPEPGTYALMASGLGVCLMLSRRRRDRG